MQSSSNDTSALTSLIGGDPRNAMKLWLPCRLSVFFPVALQKCPDCESPQAHAIHVGTRLPRLVPLTSRYRATPAVAGFLCRLQRRRNNWPDAWSPANTMRVGPVTGQSEAANRTGRGMARRFSVVVCVEMVPIVPLTATRGSNANGSSSNRLVLAVRN